ncbi:hypothetical protein JQ621_31825 [Bradyrhizobium manausense]|uniref:hypothetical protein n=1 Tax=Bradyrhizobium manausense TaxID=989370 RepID=UPI001BA7C3FA|nr:hypothetical protein [Bradyrhizobium manausense]MBR1092063.1 hypothetical protein [Bradyrhizobium manausense]
MMAALVKTLSHVTGTDVDIDGLKIVMLICGAGLCLSLLAGMTYGLNLAADLF